MSIKNHMLPGMHLGYRTTYTTEGEVLRSMTRWLKCEVADHRAGTIIGICLHTGENVEIEMDLIHTANSPNEHI